MKLIYYYGVVMLTTISISCYGPKNSSQKPANTQKGIIIYYMREPYFFPIIDTSLKNISASKALGLKLGRIEMNDIIEEVSHKRSVVVYTTGYNNKIDTSSIIVGLLLVKIKTQIFESKLSADTAAFNFEYRPNEWGLFNYAIRFNTKVLSVEPILKSDVKKLQARLKRLQRDD